MLTVAPCDAMYQVELALYRAAALLKQSTYTLAAP
jgi:hypothetical protein